MKSDIVPVPGVKWPRNKHEHKWFFLTTKNSFEPREDGAYDMVEYAYMVCNNCPAGPSIIKEIVKLKEQIDG